MLKQGNTDPHTCMKNLLILRRGEVQIDFLRGMSAELFDRPAATAIFRAFEEIEEVREYEPRIDDATPSITLDRGDYTSNYNLTLSVN